jgi:hypothetical protein
VSRVRLPTLALVGVPLLVVAALVDGLVGFAAVLLVLVVLAAAALAVQR